MGRVENKKLSPIVHVKDLFRNIWFLYPSYTVGPRVVNKTRQNCWTNRRQASSTTTSSQVNVTEQT